MSTSLCGVEVEVVKAIGILAADKSGTSDPYCTLSLLQADGKPFPSETYRTRIIKRTLNPEWGETFCVGNDFRNMPVLEGSILVASLHDEDTGMCASDNRLGQVRFGPLEILAKKRNVALDACFALQPLNNEHTTGELHLRLKLLGDPALLYEEFNWRVCNIPDHPHVRDASKDLSLDEIHARDFEGKPCNELHLTLVSAIGLLPMDSSIFSKGSSDPYVVLSVNGIKKQSKVKKQTLTPEWHENFIFPVDDDSCAVQLDVMDYDRVGSS